MRQQSDFGDRRAPRDGPSEPRPQRDLNWGERRGPLAPLPQSEAPGGARDSSRPAAQGMGERSESYRGERRQAPATWGEGRSQEDGPRAPRREFVERPDRPERAPSAADQDMKWRERMRPTAPAEEASAQETSAPASPALSNAAPASGGRPKLNLSKRTVSNVNEIPSPSAGGDSKASPFGGARPIDTSTREREIEEKREQAIREKKEADEKAKEERRLAKETAAKADAEEKEEQATPEVEGKTEDTAGEETKTQNGDAAEQKVPIRTREPREAGAYKSRATESGGWRSASGDQRGGRGGAGPRGGRGGGPSRGGRGEGRGGARSNGPPSQPASPTTESEPVSVDADGWTTVPKKGRALR